MAPPFAHATGSVHTTGVGADTGNSDLTINLKQAEPPRRPVG
jgi:hypothetical protein